MNSQETNRSIVMQNVYVSPPWGDASFVMDLALNLSVLCLPSNWIPFEFFWTIEFCRCTFSTIPHIFYTSLLSSMVTEWQLAMELVIIKIVYMLSDFSLCPLPCKSPPIRRKKIKIWTVSNHYHFYLYIWTPEKILRPGLPLFIVYCQYYILQQGRKNCVFTWRPKAE